MSPHLDKASSEVQSATAINATNPRRSSTLYCQPIRTSDISLAVANRCGRQLTLDAAGITSSER